MCRRPLIIVTLEGLATSALGCYGSAWNLTPAIDAVAASGCLWDRWIASDDDPSSMIGRWMGNATETPDWLDRRRQQGAAELLTDDLRIDPNSVASRFDRVTRLDHSDLPDQAAVDIEETGLGQLFAAAIDRDAQSSWQVMWIHSRFLTQRWDAPRSLFPVSDEENAFCEQPLPGEYDDGVAESGGAPQASLASAADSPPPLFDQVRPPNLALDQHCDPDLVTSWMRTYGCQVRLVDFLLEVLLQSIRVDDPQVIIASTSGMNLGQNGWIGHRAGPLRSCDLRLPMIISDQGPIRSSAVTPSTAWHDLLAQADAGPETLVSPEDWSADGSEFLPAVVTHSDRAALAVTTPNWQMIRESDGEEHLFLKPDDVEDVNDVARLRPDVLEQIESDGA